jgi:hypothetical protein
MPAHRSRLTPIPQLAACALVAGPCMADDPAPAKDKRGFHLFNPTPRKLMREMATDRPDKTESAYTVDAGHFQFEMDIATYAYDRDRAGGADVRADAWAVAPVNLKLGLTNNIDLQVILEPYNRLRIDDRLAGTVQLQQGFGDVTTRLKINLWGNDGGRTALAIMPFVQFPTNRDGLGNNLVEGGVIFPFAAELPLGWSLGAQAEIDFLASDLSDGYDAAFLNTVSFGHDIAGKLAGYVEFFSEVRARRAIPWIATVDIGFTYALTEDIQFDCGVNIGVTKAAPDLNPFLGLSWRF